MHSFSRLTFSVILLTTTASFAQAQTSEPRGLRTQNPAGQALTASGGTEATGKASGMGNASSNSGVVIATLDTNAGSGTQNAKTPPKGTDRANLSSERKGFQDAVQGLRKDHQSIEADRRQLREDRRSGNKEAIAADKQKLQTDRKTMHEARQNMKKERQDFREARAQEHQERVAKREQNSQDKQTKNAGNQQTTNQEVNGAQPNAAQANRRPQGEREHAQRNGREGQPQFANGHDNRGGFERPGRAQQAQSNAGPGQANRPAQPMRGGGHKGRA